MIFVFLRQNRINMDNNTYDTIIIGGSYAGLSAAMTLGRSLRKVLVIDSGTPCNQSTPHSHNFITQDGATPKSIAEKARSQVLQYKTVSFLNDLVVAGQKTKNVFKVTTTSQKQFKAQKLLFATGIKDLMPAITGFEACWGKSIIHCPYCHGYELKNEITGIYADGDDVLHYAELVSNLTSQLTIFTNGPTSLTDEQKALLNTKNIDIIEKPFKAINQEKGYLKEIIFTDGSTSQLKALYARVPFVQHSDLPEELGCEITEMGFIAVNTMQQTNIEGLYACGDNTSPMRSVANAVASGNMAGAMINKALCEAQFFKLS